MKNKIMVIDDERFSLEFFQALFMQEETIELYKFNSPIKAMENFVSISPDLVICDHLMPEMDGFEVLDRIKKDFPDVPFIMITGFGTIDKAVEAVKKGAFDYITKPFENIEDISFRVKKGLENYNLKNRVRMLEENIDKTYGLKNFVAKSKSMQEILGVITKISKVNSNVLITGESGTGKEMIANAIHNLSPRKNERFLPINCAAIPETLLESLFFGYVKGAFSGADSTRKGYFEEVDGGTIFLDEIGETSLNFQTKLLRVIQEKTLKKLGSSETVDVDVRIVCASNKDLKALVDEKSFRGDLYYRINVIEIKLPPLRERMEELPFFVDFFIKKYTKEFKKIIIKVSPDVLKKLYGHNWPGNIRELENVIERAVALEETDTLSVSSIQINSGDDDNDNDHDHDQDKFPVDYEKAKTLFEKRYLSHLISESGNNLLKASRMAGINSATLHRKINRYLK